MFRLFGVSSQDEWDYGLEVDIIDSQEEILDEDVGQVALDVLESEHDLYIVAPIAWVSQDEIDISFQKSILTIKWERVQPDEYQKDGIIIRNSECFWGRFVRNIILPENLAFNKIKAYMQDNLLIISIPKLRFDSKSIKIDKMEK